ncbi:uncharacterized protein CDAR_386661 [Caerostris darwini]|uniref:Uncharacterized protein n=1 Tax=Caerostris darwini TaxID=1538125 RepID=A0AAV4NXR4_9ARAC|nr:uncharacterized protein CDAR_386661 [Caerostris darwini]
MPGIAFAYFYIAVCIDIKCIIKHIEQSMTKSNIIKEELLHSYSVIKTTVEQIDKEVCSPVFAVILMRSNYMCYALCAILDSDRFPGRFQRLLILNACFGAFSSFIAVTSSAAMIAETVVELFSSSSIISANNGNAPLFQHFIVISQQGIALTVWRIIPITRSFIFGIIGMLLTYTVMLYGLNSHTKSC